jgi:hypothetical protein
LAYLYDHELWDQVDPSHCWVFDKAVLARRLGHRSGPAGVPVPEPGDYVVRPCINLWGMGRGARIQRLESETINIIPDGSFWSERFWGDHVSIDYHHGQQGLTVQGIRRDDRRLDRFQEWRRIEHPFELPPVLAEVAQHYADFNVEIIGDRVIEAHFRSNPDWQGHDAHTIYPRWREDPNLYPDLLYVESQDEDRLGFWLSDK